MRTFCSLFILVVIFTIALPRFTIATAYANECTKQSLSDVPNIFQVKRTGNSIQLFITPLPMSDSLTGYTISYGFQPGDERYATSFSYGSSSGVIPYTINGLDTHESYVFKIRADNGCANSPWSGYISDNFHPVGTAPTGTGTTKGGMLVAGSWEMPAFFTGVSVFFLVGGLLFLL